MLLSGLIGALIGATVTTAFNFWKFHTDELSSRIDEICKALAELARAAAEYWATDFDKVAKQRLSEANIRGSQSLVDGLYATLREDLPSAETEALDELFSQLLDSVSGGTFSEIGRPADPEKTAAAPQVASNLVVALRRTHREALPLHAVLRYLRSSPWKQWGVRRGEE